MCGIFGYFSSSLNEAPLSKIQSMGNSINYRGPDGQGIFNGSGVALGNQRLAIIDIEEGTQPFISDDGQIVVVQNGEIFNHIELSSGLKGTEYECKTHSDTEVILRLYQKHGIEFISKLNGMFAIAIYDKRIDEVFLIRDRVGEKPLYYYHKDNEYIFGSEIKALIDFGIEKNLNLQALDSYLTFNYVTPPLTMFENVQHVMPGSYLQIGRSSFSEIQWWDLNNIQQVEKSEEEWVAEFNSTLEDSVKIRLRADVPFGAFLSGGVDSSTVVGLMAKNLNQPVRTFSIGFNDERYDESPFALEAATRFNTEHVCEKVESNLLSLWGKATFHCDQPHGDVSFMPTLRVAELASKKVKMVLTGDGADELFAGYDKYKDFFTLNGFNQSDSDFRESYFDNLCLFSESSRNSLYSEQVSSTICVDEVKHSVNKILDLVPHFDRVNQALILDTYLLLSGNNLVKPDRMGMAVSIENRAPFLDYRMIELAFKMPGKIKLKDSETKYIYKKAVSNLIGHNLTYRKKQMFTVPIGNWLKNELREKVSELLFSELAQSRGLFNKEYLTSLYSDHCSDKKNNTREIRALMALEIWFREFMPDYRYED